MMALASGMIQKEMGNGEDREEDDEVKWVKHYSSNHHILLVGEGDFSFSSSLAQSFGSASNIVATSLDSHDVVVKKYKKAKSNLENLFKLGASTFHGVDATKMKLHSDLKMRKFDRIIFNFPHAGFHGKEDDKRVIKMHRKLVLGFLRNASRMLQAFGEIHIAHKTSAPFCDWNIQELAWRNCLALVDRVDFKTEDYPGYDNKRGDGTRCDKPFPLGECSTFKFRFCSAIKKMFKVAGHSEFEYQRSELYQDIPIQTHLEPTSFYDGHPQTSSSRNMINNIGHMPSLQAFNPVSADLFRHFNHASEPYEPYKRHIANRAQGCNYEIYMAETSNRSQHFQSNHFKVQHQLASFSPMDRQRELDKSMNELPGYMEEPLAISIRKRSVNAWHRNENYFANREYCCDYEMHMADASGRSLHFQSNLFKMQSKQASFSPLDHQAEFNRHMNELPVHMGPPLTINIRREIVNAPHRNADNFANQAQGCDHERYMAEAFGESLQYSSVNASEGYLNHALRKAWRPRGLFLSQHSGGTRIYDLERPVAGAPEGTLLGELNVRHNMSIRSALQRKLVLAYGQHRE